MPKVTIPLLGSVGVIQDIPPQELPPSALTSVSNMRMRDGAAERIAGDRQIFDAPTITPYGLMLYRTATDLFLVHLGLTKAFVDSSTGRTEITGTAFTGAAYDRWTGGVLNGVLVVNNGVDKPQFWGGNILNNLATLTNWNVNWTCKVMRPFRNYLVALDVTKSGTRYPHMVKWSSAADPGTVPASWDETNPAVDAGEVDLAETTDAMVDALPLGDSLIIYKSSSMYAMTYIGGQFIFSFRRLPGEQGMLAPNCGAIVPTGHVVMTAGDVVLVDGQSAQSILTGKMRKWLFSNLDSNYYARSFVVSNPQLNEVWVCFPATGSEVCSKALIWNWKDNTLTVRDLDAATCAASGQFTYASSNPWSTNTYNWNTTPTVWNNSDIPLSQASLLLGTSAPKLLVADVDTQFHGVAFSASMERTGLTFDDPDRVKLLRSMVPRIDGVTGQTIYLQAGGAMDAEATYTWSAPVAYTIGTTREATVMATGRFLAFRVYSATNYNWRIRSMDVDVRPMGLY